MNKDLIFNKVLLARHIKRPTAVKLIDYLVDGFIETHGDRLYRDDKSLICGIGYINNTPITVIAQEKGETTEDKILHNFGMPHPEGYRKALRAMKQADKFNRPIICIIDTPGAYPGIGAEERGQGYAISNNLKEMITLNVPIISIVLGEGGSGGALGIGVSDEIWMFENSIYSILSPEGFASILYKDSSLAKDAAAIMKLTAQDLYEYGIVDFIIKEVETGLQDNPTFSFELLKKALIDKIPLLNNVKKEQLILNRYNKYRKIGIYEENW